MRWSIRHRLLAPQVLLLLGIVAISVWTALASANHAEERIGRQLRGVARTLTESSFPLPRSVLEQMKGLSGAEFVLERPNGEQITTFTDGPVLLPRTDPAPDPTRLGPPVRIGNIGYRARRLPMGDRSGEPGAMLFIFYPDELLENAIWDAVRPSLLLGIFGGLATVSLTIGIGQRLIGRIRELERRTRIIAEGDFSPMPLPAPDDELRDLGRSVNEMACKLALLQEAVQKSEQLRLIGQLSSGLAHQLRNGVTGARLAVQVHARECPMGDDDALTVTLRQLSLMEANLRRFLDLSQSEGWRRETCNLGELIDEAATLLRPQCRHSHIEFRWERPDREFLIIGDPVQLGHLILNVIGNAVEAAGPNGSVEVKLFAEQNRACIEVWDNGKGPPIELAEKVFEPFVTSKPEGIGLGLTVAKRAVESHGGSLGWKRINEQTCFRIELPLEH